jgi:SAM-dependent methyltransferase
VSVPPVEVYEAGLRAARRGRTEGWRVRYADGGTADLPLGAWTGGPRPGDRGLLDRCAGPTLDLGCGPGRLTALLAARGVPVLGIDLAPHAVTLACGRGGTALRRDLFGPLPGEGRWRHLLLADGNVGIGGDPAALLRRCARLLHPAGVLLCETDPAGTGLRRTRVRLEPPAGPASAWFPWAQVGSDALPGLGDAAGLGVAARWVDRGRWFAVLAPARSGAAAKAAMPSAKPIRADQPSSSRARAEDAVTCRTSPSR